ncbi:MAG: cyclic nucleotide-binding domain-containing protein, partial [Candidatus Acidiferrales bacterium]
MLNEENRKALANVIDSTTLKDGETLFHAGEPGDALYIVRSGEIELYIKDTAGQRIVLNTARPGDFFGELALLDEGPRTATAAALADSELLVLGRDDLILLFQKNPDAALHMLASLGRMTRKADELLRTRVSRNLNVEEEETSTFGQRIADRVARFGGSWTFIILFGVFMLFWISTNAFRGAGAFDPFPYILLNLALSMLAAMQAPVIM